MKKIITLSLLTASILIADPFVAYPGTKAKGMGGAFTAVANNNSAMYFNPAGMTNFESYQSHKMLTLEAGTGAGYDGPKNEFTDSFTYFAAYGVSGNGWSGGLAVYSLYTLEGIATDSNYQPIGGDFDNSVRKQDISVISASLAYQLVDQIHPWGGKLSIGATLGMGFSGGGLLNYTSESNDGTTSSSVTDKTLDQRGLLYGVGIKARIFESMTFKVDVGANYRAQTEMDSFESDTHSFEQVNGFDIPQEIAFGIAAMYFNEYGVFTLAVDQKTTGYEEASRIENTQFFPLYRVSNERLDGVGLIPDYQTTAIGFDYSGPMLSLRAGVYESTGVDTDYAPQVSGKTIGAGFEYGSAMLEVSIDSKSYDISEITLNDLTLYSFSANWTF